MSFDEALRGFKEWFDGWGGAEKSEQFTQDHVYIEEHWEELLKEYPDKWIAVLQGKIIASADSSSALISAIPKQDRGSTAIKFMDTDPKPLILIAA